MGSQGLLIMELYKLSFPNGKNYVGITSKTAKKRFQEHCKPSKKLYLVNKAIDEYGRKNVSINVIGRTDNLELLCLAEHEAIEKYNSRYPNGYNSTQGGEGYLCSEESRKRASEFNKGNKYCLGFKHTKESIAIMSESKKGNQHTLGFKHTEESKKKMSLATKAKPFSEEHRKNLSKATAEANRRRTGMKHSEETKAKMSAARIGKKLSEEHINILAEANRKRCTGTKRSEETKAKISMKAKERFLKKQQLGT
jgi:group I intron endonuclease